MVEICLRVHDKINDTSPILDAGCTKRGDVIDVLDDGADWGRDVRSRADWRIIRLPNIPRAEAEAFLAPEPEDTPQDPSPVRQRRAFKLDIDDPAVATTFPVFAAWLADDTRTQPSFTVNMTVAQLRAIKKRKPALPRP